MGGKVTDLESLLDGIESQILSRKRKTNDMISCKIIELAQKEIHHRELIELMVRIEGKLDVFLNKK